MAPVFLFCHKKSYLCTLSHYRVIRMNHVDTIWREWLPPRTGGTACSATPKGGGGSLSARHNSLSFMAQAAVKKSDSAGIFLNKYLEIRENRVHTQELARRDTANHLICKELADFFSPSASDIFQETPPTQAISPPARCRMAETFIYPRNRVTHVNAVPAGFRGFLYPIKNK